VQFSATEAPQRPALPRRELAGDRDYLGDLLRGENGAGDPRAACPAPPRCPPYKSAFATCSRDLGMTVHAHRDLPVLQALGGIEDQPRPLYIAKRQRRRLRPALKLTLLPGRQLDQITAAPRHNDHFAAPQTPPSHSSTRFRTAQLVGQAT
jgi:hypothetical protein